MAILKCFNEQDSVLSLADIAHRTGLYKSTILRITVSLEDAAFLVRRPDKTYALGSEVLRLAAVYQRSLRLEEIVRPALRHLLAVSGESASFFRRNGESRICVYREDSSHAIRDHVREGDLLPLDRGAAGHVLTDFDPATNDLDDLLRRAGSLPLYSFGERDAEAAAVAVPVFALSGGTITLAGALALSGPRIRFSDDVVDKMRRLLATTAQELSDALGGGSYWRMLGLTVPRDGSLP